ncbi:hypothetical protein R7D64_16760 [Vibrio sp. Vb2535]|uniref:hypothetical protein n=1 Tax=Vibrio sp. Vb2535 TaxID=3074667 RepID=UPI00296422AD|nr:hypothetical protein [Vibrio sp. Vb2535]MDW1754575.1 hypothetical protein [Vibrio sp. Vb2535]
MTNNIGTELIVYLMKYGIEEGARKFMLTDWFSKTDEEQAQDNRRQVQGAFNQYGRTLLSFIGDDENPAFDALKNKEFYDFKRQLDEVECSLGKQFFDYHIRPRLVIDECLMNKLRAHGIKRGIEFYIEEKGDYDLEVIITTLDDYSRQYSKTTLEYIELVERLIDEWNYRGGRFIEV